MPASGQAQGCPESAHPLTLLDRVDARGRGPRVCLRNLQLGSLAAHGERGVAAVVRATGGPDVVEVDAGDGPREVAPGQAMLAAWDEDGALRFLTELSNEALDPVPAGTVLVANARGDSWLLLDDFTQLRFQAFDAQGVQRAAGELPLGPRNLQLWVDGAGCATLLGAPPDFGELATVLLKVAPAGETVWRQELDVALDTASLAVDDLGRAYIADFGERTLTQYAP